MDLNHQLSDKAQQDFILVEAALSGDEKAFAKLFYQINIRSEICFLINY